MIRVKICGITRAADAELACALGADALGLVFHPPSPRCVTVDQARTILRSVPPFVTTVGVFVDRPLDDVAEILRATGLHLAQLHGDEPADMMRAAPFPAYKAFRVNAGFDVERLRAYAGSGPLLLDAHADDAHGGTGRTFDWTLARAARSLGPIILAGGLHAENVAEAVRVARPAAIDVSSGVESAPGMKAPDRLRALFRVVDSLHSLGDIP